MVLNILFPIFVRSEQDKEPEQEVAAEASGSGPSEESAAESMSST